MAGILPARKLSPDLGRTCFCIKLQYTPRHNVHTPGCAVLLQLGVYKNLKQHAYMRAGAKPVHTFASTLLLQTSLPE